MIFSFLNNKLLLNLKTFCIFKFKKLFPFCLKHFFGKGYMYIMLHNFIKWSFFCLVLVKPQKKVLFFVVRPLRRGGGKGPTTWEKRTFFYKYSYILAQKFLWPLSRGGGGVKALVVGLLKKELFFAASLSLRNINQEIIKATYMEPLSNKGCFYILFSIYHFWGEEKLIFSC